MNFDDLQKRAIQISDKYDALNKQKGNKSWGTQQYMAGFVGDVGDLSKIIMAKQAFRPMEDVDSKLAHELSDCLWSVLVLANKCGVDLSSEFVKTMDALDEKIDNLMAKN